MAAYFEVAPAGLKFKFDGETLKDSDTFRSIGIEEDDMIDAEVICIVSDMPICMPHILNSYSYTAYIHSKTAYSTYVDEMHSK